MGLFHQSPPGLGINSQVPVGIPCLNQWCPTETSWPQGSVLKPGTGHPLPPCSCPASDPAGCSADPTHSSNDGSCRYFPQPKAFCSILEVSRQTPLATDPTRTHSILLTINLFLHGVYTHQHITDEHTQSKLPSKISPCPRVDAAF